MARYRVEYACGCRVEGNVEDRWAKEVCERKTCLHHGAERLKLSFPKRPEPEDRAKK